MNNARRMVFFSIGLGLSALFGCSADVDSTKSELEAIGAAAETATGSTPVTPPDAEFLYELPNLPANVYYTGFGTADTQIYVRARTRESRSGTRAPAPWCPRK